MTYNLYVGVDLTKLLRAQSIDDLRHIAGRLLADVEAHPYSARIEAIADAVAASEPDVVGLQEAGVVRTQTPGDFPDDPTANASEVVVDLLDLLVSKLDDRGLAYEVAASTVNTDLEVPADVDGEAVDVRVTDRTALLVREGVETGESRTGTFDAALSYPIDATAIPIDAPALSIDRGYCTLDVTVDETDLTVATTHLEASDDGPRREQAAELLELVPDDRPVVIAGDLNSGPGGSTGAYDRLTASFDDAYSALHPDERGYTCCQAADLRNGRSELFRRIDAVLVRGGLEPITVDRVGATPADRVDATVNGETVRLWPSDHAGVVATVEVAPSAGEASSTQPLSTASPQDDERSVPLVGFGTVSAVVALVIAALARLRRSE